MGAAFRLFDEERTRSVKRCSRESSTSRSSRPTRPVPIILRPSAVFPLEALRLEHLWPDLHALDPATVLGRALARAGGITPQRLTPVPPASGVALEMTREHGLALLTCWAATPSLEAAHYHPLRSEIAPLRTSGSSRRDESEPALAAFLEVLTEHQSEK